MQSPSKHVSLAVVIPTLGRETLAATLDSVLPQMLDGDRLIVAADEAGDWTHVARLVHAQKGLLPVKSELLLARVPPNEEGNGYAQRTFGMRCAGRTTHVAFMDDDDVYVDGALETIRENADMKGPTLFKMMYGSETYASHPGTTLWRSQDVVYGNVGTPMFVTPNKWDKLGSWKACQEFHGKPCGGDFTFISETIEKFGGVKWVDRVIALIKPAPQSGGSRSTSST